MDRSGTGRAKVLLLGLALFTSPLAGLRIPRPLTPTPMRPPEPFLRLTIPDLEPDLAALLDKLTAYAGRLERSILDFVCREEILETIDYGLDASSRSPRPLMDWSADGRSATVRIPSRRGARIKRTYVYDYQCVRGKSGLLRESRILLEDDGKKVRVPNATLKTEVFVFGTPLLGPVGVFGERFRPYYDYAVTGREEIDGRPVVVIEAVPAVDRPGATNLYGKAWVGAADGELLKIEWSESRIGRREIFEARAETYKLRPRITLRSEFSAERNGIRFPSRLWMEEAYLNERDRAFVRSRTAVVYKDFKFFTVEVGDIEIR